jgi:hypothetical protein
VNIDAHIGGFFFYDEKKRASASATDREKRRVNEKLIKSVRVFVGHIVSTYNNKHSYYSYSSSFEIDFNSGKTHLVFMQPHREEVRIAFFLGNEYRRAMQPMIRFTLIAFMSPQLESRRMRERDFLE